LNFPLLIYIFLFSAALSLSSSASSGVKDQWEKEGAEFIRKGVEELPDEVTSISP